MPSALKDTRVSVGLLLSTTEPMRSSRSRFLLRIATSVQANLGARIPDNEPLVGHRLL